MLADYIKFTSTQRIAAGKDECKQTCVKLMNDALYGKAIENVAKRTFIKFLIDIDKAQGLAEYSQCINFRLFNPKQVDGKSRKLY